MEGVGQEASIMVLLGFTFDVSLELSGIREEGVKDY